MTEQDYEGFLLVCAKNKQKFDYFGREVTVSGISTYGDIFAVRHHFELSCGSTVVFTHKNKETK